MQTSLLFSPAQYDDFHLKLNCLDVVKRSVSKQRLHNSYDAHSVIFFFSIQKFMMMEQENLQLKRLLSSARYSISCDEILESVQLDKTIKLGRQ